MNYQNLYFKFIEGIPDKKILQDLLKLYKNIFDDADEVFFIERIKTKENILILIAYDNEIPIGFKIGYRYNETTFYSWVGGVLENYRKKGVAKQLAKLQENWCKKKQFSKIRTKSMNKFKSMLILNLKNDFNIVQVYTNQKKQTKIVFEKLI